MEDQPMIQVSLREYEKSVLEKDKLRKRIEYLENVRVEDIKTIRELKNYIEHIESLASKR